MPRPLAHGGLPQLLAKKTGNFFHDDLVNEAYHLVNRASSTVVKDCLKSGAHAQHRKFWPKATEAMAFGTLVHLMLECPEWRAELAVAPDFGDLRKKASRETKAEWVKEHEDKIQCTSEQLGALLRIEENCKSKPMINVLLDGAKHEVSGFWDGQYDVPCKFRADVVTADNVIIDWKTCQDATKFMWDAKKWQYHLQAAFYLEGLGAVVKEKLQDFMFVAIESVPPYDCLIYHLDYDSLQRGQQMVSDAMLVYAENSQREKWEGYSDDVRNLSIH